LDAALVAVNKQRVAIVDRRQALTGQAVRQTILNLSSSGVDEIGSDRRRVEGINHNTRIGFAVVWRFERGSKFAIQPSRS
jgi:hypothetical protein